MQRCQCRTDVQPPLPRSPHSAATLPALLYILRNTLLQLATLIAMMDSEVTAGSGILHPHLQYRELRPHHSAHVAEDLGPQRPVHLAEDAQLVEGQGRLPPAEGEEAPHLARETSAGVTRGMLTARGPIGFVSVMASPEQHGLQHNGRP
jgi:hypothetical protein